MDISYWLAAIHMPSITPRIFLRGLSPFSDIEKLFAASRDELKAAGFNDKQIEALMHPDWKAVEKDLQWALGEDHHLIAHSDQYYPSQLREMADPPLVLYVQGNKQALSQTQIAVVGSRQATPTGIKNAEQFSYLLAKAGMVITSGLALGIDGAAHRGAMAAKGITLGVCGTGLNHLYPASHRTLAAEMVRSEGALISEFPLSTQPNPWNFPRRNRVISGLSLGVLVVEAALKSGSLITAKHALDQGRDVFAIPSSIHHSLAKGCHYLIKQGAKLVETADDILQEVRDWRAAPPMPPLPSSMEALAPDEKKIFQQIGYEITPIDMIIWRSGLTAKEVSSILLILELNGYIQSIPGGYIRAVLT